jgi:hypothetical protein
MMKHLRAVNINIISNESIAAKGNEQRSLDVGTFPQLSQETFGDREASDLQ